MSEVLNRFLRYVKIDTRSVEAEPCESAAHPSSQGQIELAEILKKELAGSSGEISSFSDGSFLVHFKANSKSSQDSIHVAFAAHLDTYYGLSGKVKPTVHLYAGGDLLINGTTGSFISANELDGLKGKKLVTSDGTSLLGADDKAGVAAMMETIAELEDKSIEHGPITFWFCVDEEIGSLDVAVLPEEIVRSWDILWTLDGERLGPIDVGCLIAARCTALFDGVSAHPGVAGDKLKPAQYAAVELGAALIEKDPSPMETSGMECFGYVDKIEADSTKAKVVYLPRAFERDKVDEMIKSFEKLVKKYAREYGVYGSTTSQILGANTRQAAEKRMDLIQPAVEILAKEGYKVELLDIRGGTDGGMLNLVYPDLAAPNMGTGSVDLHTNREFLVVEELEKLVGVLISLVKRYASMGR